MHVTLEQFRALRHKVETPHGAMLIFSQDKDRHPLNQLIRNAITNTQQRFLAFGSIDAKKKYTLLGCMQGRYNIYLLVDYERVIWSIHPINLREHADFEGIQSSIAAAESMIEHSDDGCRWRLREPNAIDVVPGVDPQLAKKLKSAIRKKIRDVFL